MSKLKPCIFTRRVGQRIRWVREIRGLTLQDVARQTSVNNRTLSKYEHGKISFSLSALDQISKVLSIPTYYLTAGTSTFTAQLASIAEDVEVNTD